MFKRGFVSFVVVVTIFLFFGFVGRAETIYRVDAKVISISQENDEILFEDGRGEIWSIYYEQGFTEGQRVKLTMDTNFTEETREDDIIIKVKK